jgi:Ca2+-binding RTX toxin-like protein
LDVHLQQPLQTGSYFVATINGNNSNNTLNGTSSADTIHGLGGADTISGKGGADYLYGDSGATPSMAMPETTGSGAALARMPCGAATTTTNSTAKAATII